MHDLFCFSSNSTKILILFKKTFIFLLVFLSFFVYILYSSLFCECKNSENCQHRPYLFNNPFITEGIIKKLKKIRERKICTKTLRRKKGILPEKIHHIYLLNIHVITEPENVCNIIELSLIKSFYSGYFFVLFYWKIFFVFFNWKIFLCSLFATYCWSNTLLIHGEHRFSPFYYYFPVPRASVLNRREETKCFPF